MNRILLTAVLIALPLTGAACANNSPRPPIQGRMDPYIPDQVNLDSPRLRNQIVFGTVNISRDRGDILYVNLPIRTDVNGSIDVDYRITYLDRNGQVLYGGGSWMHKRLQANIPDTISGNSLSADAYDVRIGLRYAE